MKILKTLIYDASKESLDPYLNLAREEAFLSALKADEALLYLWRNEHTVVIGKNQNAFRECDVSRLEADGGHLARRLSGGGAVYHDRDNLNYTIFVPSSAYDIARQTQVILQAVRSLGLEPEASGRNDLLLDGRKFSGTAYYRTKDMCYQHGTLLMKVDEEKMTRCLTPSKAKLEAKGVLSVRSRVVGLNELDSSLTLEALTEAMKKAFETVYGCEALSYEGPDTWTELRAKYADPTWIYGQRRPFNLTMEDRFPWGEIQLSLQVESGRIHECMVHTDAMDTELSNTLENILQGVAASPTLITEALAKAAATGRIEGSPAEDIKTMIERWM